MLPFADGSDSGGSLRYPASFCNIVGLRPSPGRVPTGRIANGWSPHAVLGPMARNARDTGLLLAAIAGEDWRAPLSLQGDPMTYASIEAADLRGVRIAWSNTVAGLPVDPGVTQVLQATRAQLTDLGCIVEEVELDLQDADLAWEIIEFQDFAAAYGKDVETFGDRLRPDLVENVRIGRALTVEQIAWAETVRTEIFRRTAKLLRSYDLVATPAAPVVAPPVECEWVREIEGVRMERYFGWQRIASRVTMTAHPALSMPAGFTHQGLPVGLQLVGRYRDELSLLRYAAAFDDAAGFTRQHPKDIA
jgi:amidase